MLAKMFMFRQIEILIQVVEHILKMLTLYIETPIFDHKQVCIESIQKVAIELDIRYDKQMLIFCSFSLSGHCALIPDLSITHTMVATNQY